MSFGSLGNEIQKGSGVRKQPVEVLGVGKRSASGEVIDPSANPEEVLAGKQAAEEEMYEEDTWGTVNPETSTILEKDSAGDKGPEISAGEDQQLNRAA
jgi:hypothetical protein